MDVPAKTIYRGDNLDDEKRDLRAISHTLHNSAREGLRRCPNWYQLLAVLYSDINLEDYLRWNWQQFWTD